MALYFAEGSPAAEFPTSRLREILGQVYERLGVRDRVLAVPPDATRFESRAGLLTQLTYEHFGSRLTDILPALGTHFPMEEPQLARMFGDVPRELFRVHRWREDVVTIGEVPASFVTETTEGVYTDAWPVQLNKLVWEGGHDLILSIGQVVPHEVIGMANYNKNMFVGTGGARGINESHYLSAVYGMERVMGRADNPLRRILNYGQDNFCQELPLVYVLTVVGMDDQGETHLRGLFIGDDHECFERAAELAQQLNITKLSREPKKVVVYLEPEEFQSTWLGNKAIYRTRMAIADGGELIVLAPGVRIFGEDPEIDRLIRRYGYCDTPNIVRLVQEQEELRNNLAAAAHLIHGSSEGRFAITYCPGHLSKDEIEQVGYKYGDLDAMSAKYNPQQLAEGWNRLADGEEVFFIQKPALGLWASTDRFS